MSNSSGSESQPFDAVSSILVLYQRWGQDRGLREIKDLIERTSDPHRKTQLTLVAGWISGERGDFVEADTALAGIDRTPAARAWAATCRAFIAVRGRDFEKAKKLYHEANWLLKDHALDDLCLKATLAHCWGTLRFHEGADYHDEAIAKLYEALELFGKSHFGTGRVLDTIGMYFANKRAYGLAIEFYQWGLLCKSQFQDQLGVAISHGQLGRLHLDWGNLEKAEHHFHQDLQIAELTGDQWGVATMLNALGRVELARRNDEAALAYLNKSVKLQEGKPGWEHSEAFARKDRALARILNCNGEVRAAREDAERAKQLFTQKTICSG